MDTFEKYKTEIDLAEFAGSLGYTPYKKKSTAKYRVLEKDGDIVIFSKNKATGEHYYWNENESSDKGDIISFAKNRVHMLGSIDVPEYVKNQDLFIINQTLASFKGHVFQDTAYTAAKKPSTFNINLYKYYPAQDLKILNQRGIDSIIVKDHLFKGRIHNSEFKGKVNIAFPLYDVKDKKIGFDFRDKGVKKLATGTNRKEGMWTSNRPEKTDKIVVAESPIDLLSYHELHPGKNNYYMATHGSITEYHIERIAKLSRETGAKIALAQDADIAGYTMSLKVIAGDKGIPVKNMNEKIGVRLDGEKWMKMKDVVKRKNAQLRELNPSIQDRELITGGQIENDIIVLFPENKEMISFACQSFIETLGINAELDMPTKGKDYNEQLQLEKKTAVKFTGKSL